MYTYVVHMDQGISRVGSISKTHHFFLFFIFYSEKVKIKDTPIQLARSLYYELKSDFDHMELIFIIWCMSDIVRRSISIDVGMINVQYSQLLSINLAKSSHGTSMAYVSPFPTYVGDFTTQIYIYLSHS
jgi:hypothetical protein